MIHYLAIFLAGATAVLAPLADEALQVQREEQLRQLEKVLPLVSGDQRADLLFQRAELFWKKSFSGDTEACRREALRSYEELLTQFPRYPRRDEVLFSYASNQYEAGKKTLALDAWRQLVATFPQSKLVPDAWLQIGEHYFNANQPERAREAYEKVDRPYALYKRAWCDLNLGTRDGYLQALAKFKKVVAGSDAGLRADALNDLVQVYVQLDRPGEGADYLRANTGRETGRKLADALGRKLLEAGHFESAAQVFTRLIDEAPDLALREALLRCHEGMRHRAAALAELRRIVDTYAPAPEAEAILRQRIADLHSEAQKTHAPETLQQTRGLYPLYLDHFPDAPQLAQERELYAELLWNLGAYAEAAGQYEKVGSASAAYNAALAWEKAGDEKALLATLDRYVKAYPVTLQTPDCRRKADELRATSRFAALREQAKQDARSAAQGFETLANEHPATPLGTRSLLFALSLYENDLHLPAEALRVGEKLLSDPRDLPETAQVLYDVFRLSDGVGDRDRAIQWARAYLERFPKGSARAEVDFWLLTRDLSEEKARTVARVYESLPAPLKGVASNRAAYAQARFLVLEGAWRQYVAIRFDSPGRFKKSFAAKQGELERLKLAYLDVVKLGVPEWALAASVRIGLACREFARSLLESPFPEGIDEEGRKSYRARLEEGVAPLEAQALEALKSGLETGQKNGVTGEWIAAAQQALGVMP